MIAKHVPYNFGFNFPEKASVMLLIGPSRAGKSHFLKAYILDMSVNRHYFNFGIAFLGTAYNKDSYNYLPEKAIIVGYDENRLVSYLDTLKAIRKSGRQLPPNFIILDDVMGLLKDNSPVFTNLITTYRWTNTTVIIGIQYANKLNAVIKSNTSFAIMFNSKQKRMIHGLYENFGQLFDNEAQFKRHYFQITSRKYTACLFNEEENELDKNYLPIKAPAELPDTKLVY